MSDPIDELFGEKKEPPVVSIPRAPKRPITKIIEKVVEKEVEVFIERFDKQEYTDISTAVDAFLRTNNNPKRQEHIKPNGIVDKRNKRMIKLLGKLEDILK